MAWTADLPGMRGQLCCEWARRLCTALDLWAGLSQREFCVAERCRLRNEMRYVDVAAAPIIMLTSNTLQDTRAEEFMNDQSVRYFSQLSLYPKPTQQTLTTSAYRGSTCLLPTSPLIWLTSFIGWLVLPEADCPNKRIMNHLLVVVAEPV